MKRAMLILTALLLFSSVGLAQLTQESKTIDLSPTDCGQACDLLAYATISKYATEKTTTEVFSVIVDATMDDEEVLQVLVGKTTGEENIPVGSITIFEGCGCLILMNHPSFWNTTPGDLPIPLNQIRSVKLVHEDELMAAGAFYKPNPKEVPRVREGATPSVVPF